MSVNQETLKRHFKYDTETGILYRVKKDNTLRVSGTVDCNGYIKVVFKKKEYLAHRLIWVYLHGKNPNQIDHINHNRTDNSLLNLREVTNKENHRNRTKQKNNTSGATGVQWNKKSKKWAACIHEDRSKRIHLGYFCEFSEAVNARKNAEVLYGFHKNHGKG